MSEAENFARLMRELKERAGLSYGALARRLHTSTSTLHRYCKGEALPAEFAVVDRFARACGATREEALDLHRAWLLADARRRAGAAEVPEPVPVPEPESESESEPTVVVTPDPEPEPVARGVWYRRRAAVVAAAGVTAGAVAVALLSAAGPGPGAPHAGGSTGPGAGTGAGSGAGTSAPPFVGSGSASAPTSTGAPEPTPPVGATGSAGATAAVPVPSFASPPASAPGRDPVAPLKAAVRSHVWTAGCDHAYLSERGPGSVPPPPVEADAPAWASAQRAVHAGTQIVEVTLHGTGEGAVVLEDLEVRVTARRKPPAWNVYQMSQGCGGGLTPAAFAVNLDAPRPLARPVAGNDGGNALPAPSFPLRVSAAEPAVLRVEAATTGCDCDWSLDLRWTGPTGSGTLRIDEGGRPLRTSAAPGRPVYGYALEQGRWAR